MEKNPSVQFPGRWRSKDLVPARNSCFPKKLNQFEKTAEKSKKGLLFLPMGEGAVTFSSSYKTLRFLNQKLDKFSVCFQCLLQISLSFNLSCFSPATGRADFWFIFRRGRWWCFTCLGKSLAQGVPLEHNCLQNRLFRKGIFRLVPRDRAGPNHSQ